MDISRIEQDVASKESKSEHFKAISELIKDKTVDSYDKVRLVLLFAIRYESDSKVLTLKQMLITYGADASYVSLID